MRSTLWVGFHLFIFSLVGVVVVIAGLYVVLWGKAKEFAENKQTWLSSFHHYLINKCYVIRLCVCVGVWVCGCERLCMIFVK